jgi:hypothetical protein
MILVAALATFELLAHPLILAAVPSETSWDRAADFLRAELGPNDRVVAAPQWIDPIVRQKIGDLLSLRAAAPPDDGGFERLWELSIRDASTRADPPALQKRFGEVRLRMWRLEAPRLVYDFVEHLPGARVELDTQDGPQACPWTSARPGRGGLETGPMMPAERFLCDRRRPWLHVGATVLADLELRPRRCIWQHPAGEHPLRTLFSEVPLGDRLVVHAGIDYQAERRERYAPVTLRIWIDEVLAGELIHRDGDGWTGLTIDTSARAGETATVRFEATTPNPTARLFCYSASTQVSEHD